MQTAFCRTADRVQSIFQISGCLRNGYLKWSPTLKNIPALISGKSYYVQGIIFYFLCMEEHKHTSHASWAWNSSKGQELYPFCCSASYIKIVLFTASRGLCCDSFTVFLHSVFKVMPWEQNFSFKTWISKCSKIHRHLWHVLKIVIPHQSQGQHYPCRSEVSWSSRSSDNVHSFQPSKEGLHLICSEIHWDMMIVLKTQLWQWLQDSSRGKFGVIPPSLWNCL